MITPVLDADCCETVTYKKTVTVKIADADGEPIRIGAVLREVGEKTEGVVKQIVREGSVVFVPMAQIGDLVIQTGLGTSRVTNRYSAWRHVPQKEQTYEQRFTSWLCRPYDHDEMRQIPEAEGLAIDGIMSLLPDDVVDWENGPWPDKLEDALRFLVDHLTGLKVAERRKKGRPR